MMARKVKVEPGDCKVVTHRKGRLVLRIDAWEIVVDRGQHKQPRVSIVDHDDGSETTYMLDEPGFSSCC